MKQIATRLTALLLALVMTTTLALAANKSGYSDVPDKNWASQSIAQCKQYNLLQGIGGGKFGLGQKMTRAAYAAALCRLMGWKTVTPEKGSYTDNQNAKKWYYSAIETASAHDVFSGHSTTCRPNDPITREEMAAMTVRALGYSTLSGTVQDECPFTDVSTNPGYITLAWRMGLVVGMNLTTFAPKNDTTREQAAAVLLRAYHGLKAKVSVTSVSAAPSGAVPAESLTGTSGAVPLSP
ncbi:S-layer homology domain-containing protein, partial [Ruminococcaceae bacterium TF06-43]